MTISETKIDFLGEMVGLDDLIKRIEEMAKTETSFSDPWFIGECVYSCGNIPLTIPFKTFGDFVTAFSNGQHPSSVTDDSGGLRFNFDIDGEPNVSNQLTSAFYRCRGRRRGRRDRTGHPDARPAEARHHPALVLPRSLGQRHRRVDRHAQKHGAAS